MGVGCVRFRRLEELPLDLIASQIASTGVDEFVRRVRAARSTPALTYIEPASRTSVNGPSFSSSTSMSAPKTPRPTRNPRRSSAAANASTRSDADVGRRRRRP